MGRNLVRKKKEIFVKVKENVAIYKKENKARNPVNQ